MRVAPAVPAAECCAGGVPVVSRARRRARQRGRRM